MFRLLDAYRNKQSCLQYFPFSFSLAVLDAFDRSMHRFRYVLFSLHCVCARSLALGTDQPECSLTVKHILIECPALTSTRNRLYTASMKDLFDNGAARNIINFIKESQFYNTL